MAVLTVMPAHPHSLPTCRADRYVGPSSIHSNRPCEPLCRNRLTAVKQAVLTVMPDHPHFTQIDRANTYDGHSLLPSNRRADRYAGLSALYSNWPCCPIFRSLFTPLQLALLTIMPNHYHSTPTGRADTPHFLPTARVDSYDG